MNIPDETHFHIDQDFDLTIKNIRDRYNYAYYNGLFQKCINAVELLIKEIFKITHSNDQSMMCIILSFDSFLEEIDLEANCVSSTVRIHKDRHSEQWLDSDLERYAQPILVIKFKTSDSNVLTKKWWKTT